MHAKYGQQISIDLSFNLAVNGSELQVTGVSRGVFGGGTPTAVLQSRGVIPQGFDIGLLSYVALTGHPSMSRTAAGADNPFLRTGGIYSARRRLDLGERGGLATDYR